MAQKKMVNDITSMDVDFAQWYTDIVKKAQLADYSGVKGCIVYQPYGYAIWAERIYAHAYPGKPAAKGKGSH